MGFAMQPLGEMFFIKNACVTRLFLASIDDMHVEGPKKIKTGLCWGMQLPGMHAICEVRS
jgi:hypothetical protein